MFVNSVYIRVYVIHTYLVYGNVKNQNYLIKKETFNSVTMKELCLIII